MPAEPEDDELVTTYSYQLYSSRNFGPLPATLKMLSDLGYGQVEGYGGLFAGLDDLDAFAAALAANGLEMPSSHIGLDTVEDDPDEVIRIGKTCGIRRFFAPHLAADQRPSDDDGWRAFGARLEAAGKPLRDAGLEFGWHNHEFEFSTTGGAHPLDLILSGGPGLPLEFDVAWAARVGQDPLPWIENYGGRIVAAHVKDIASEGQKLDEDGWADVGDGVMDWRGIMAALTDAGCELFVAEHDNPNDDVRFATRTIAFLNSL